MKRQILISAIILLCLQAGLAGATDLPYKQGELIVRFANPGAEATIGPLSSRARRNMLSNLIIAGATVDKEYEHIIPGLALVKLPKGTTVLEAVIKFNQSANILYAEPNYKIRAFQTFPNDPRFEEQWALDNTGQTDGLPDADIDAPEAWDIHTGDPNVIVAVLDSGIDYNHPDLAANMWINPGEVNQPGVVEPNDFNDVDDDDNGYVDDIYGYDFVDNDSNPMDEHYHGTVAAGIIGAVGNNDEGIAGVCWTVRLMALRILDTNGEGSVGDAIEAIEYAILMGADVINASWGTYDYMYSQSLYDVIADAGDAGILFVAGAGNDGYYGAAYPAAYGGYYGLDNVISVMATDHNDNRAYWSFGSASNYGYNVDLGAPGMFILSTFPTNETAAMAARGYSTDYDVLDGNDVPVAQGRSISGTSAAAPYVAGAAALMWSVNPDFTHTQIKQLILRSVDKTLPGLCVSEGRLNLANAMNMVKPGRVRNVVDYLSLSMTTDAIYDTIQEAINNASDGDLLIADANHWYFEVIDFNGLEITLRSGDVNNPPGVISPATTYISGLFDAYNDIVTFQSGEDANTALLGFTIIDGYDGIYCYNDSDPNISNCIITGNSGDGIYCYYDSDPNISNCMITGNSGGGIYCYYNSDPNISSCTITANTTWGEGGGIYCGYGSDPNITNCTITANTASGGGGGIYCTSGSDPNITNCAITGNSAGNGAGGGIYCVDSSPEISDCNISGNTAEWAGGGIYLENASPTITNCQITDSNSHWDGGGIYCGSGSDANITNSTISSNFAYYDGGGIYCADSSPLIKNCLIIDNTVDSWDGGGIFCSDGSPTITNCTIAGNSANNYDGLGGALYSLGPSRPVITNCIFSNNEDIAIYESDLNSDANVAYCLFYNNPDGDYYDFYIGAPYDFNSVVDPNGNFNQDPMFVRGRLGNYYLSQFEAGQILDSNGRVVDPNVNPEDATSPAVDAGSADANSLGMHLYSTRTDNVADSGTVDIGYHYDDPLPVVQFYLYAYAINGSISPQSGLYTQYTQVPLKAAPNPGYQLKSWSGTDDDTSRELNNIVTMDSYKYVVVEFQAIMVELRARVVGGNGTVTPRGGRYRRGTVVTLTATPANPSFRAIWTGTDDDTLTLFTNTVTMIEPFIVDPQGREFKEVEVRFYAPRTLNVPGDYTNLQHAIDDAMDGDIIVIAPADQPYLTVDGFYIYGRAITITSANPDDPCCIASTVIEMQSPGPDGTVGPAFYFYYVGRDTVLNGLTIRGFNMYGGNGRGGDSGADPPYWDGVPGGSVYGAAIRCWSDASPTIKNCIITDCSARGGNGGNGAGGNDDHPDGGHGGWPGRGYGGGMGCLDDSNPLVINCTFDNCRAYGGNGGNGGNGNGDPWGPGGRGGGWYYSYPPYTPYEWAHFDFYTAYSGHGGAVYCDQSSSATFIDCTFTNNRTEGGTCGISGITPPGYRAEPTIHWKIDNFGGAVYLGGYPYYYYYYYPFYPYDYNEPMNESKFMNCTFANNTADPTTTPDSEDQFVSYGGAVAFEANSVPSFDNCAFNDNMASIGGAMYWEWAEPLIDDCNFVANTGLHGGGVYFVGGSSKIYRSNFRENHATVVVAEGGGIYCFDANAMIVDCNISNNDASGSGGGIYFGGSEKLLVKNCLITENSAGRDGGGISANWNSESNIINCTIVGNTVTGVGFDTGYGGGVCCSYENYALITNSIIWGNYAINGGDLAITTGFEQDPRPAYVKVAYSDIEGGEPEVFVDIGCTLEWDIDPGDPNYPTNIDADPLFTDGYHLSQIEAGDVIDSPCVDVGSDSAIALGLYGYTTRTDDVPDRGIVDMGYHYGMPIRMVSCDFDFDGDVDLADLGILSSYWLEDRCDLLGWCEGADLDSDRDVDFRDYAIYAQAYAPPVDLTPPTPNPSEWETLPYEYYNPDDGKYYNRMVAVTASDLNGVEYYFDCWEDAYDSGWQDSPIYNVHVTVPIQQYSYRVKTRDKSPNQNETDYSVWRYPPL